MKTTAKIVSIVVLALLSACGGVNSRIKKNQDKFQSYPPEAQQKIRNGQIDVGFSKDMVEMALGKPDRVYTRKTESGSQEIWAYTEGGGSTSYVLGATPGGGYTVAAVEVEKR